ncbi:AAA family ATPase [Pseudomonas sp. S 311-6]|nr:AAA family ATPase [Pseudomonas sp. S 311-6]
MGLSSEVRKLQNKWQTNSGWPKRLEWLEISGIHGWEGQRIDFLFPIVAIVGENGAGKSTVIQSAASIYAQPSGEKQYYPSFFFPDTTWEKINEGSIRYSVREGDRSRTDILKKLARWRGYSKRPSRVVEYIDLSRVQPVGARLGYLRLANPQLKETAIQDLWTDEKVRRLSHLLGKKYESARMATTEIDGKRKIPVLNINGKSISGFHQGAGEITTAELLQSPFMKNSIILIDEIESSLHPRAQRRLIRELAEQCRLHDLQIILTTHSPYVLDELPPEARIQILNEPSGKTIVSGVSPEFAMTRMDEETHPECDLYVEDERAESLLREMLVVFAPEIVSRCQIIPYGTASVGYALGQMANGQRFPRPSCVFVDGDQEERAGCLALPGGDAPERVVFNGLMRINWGDLHARISRGFGETADACLKAMNSEAHHQWVTEAANELLVAGSVLWQAMAAVWARNSANPEDLRKISEAIQAELDRDRG